MPVAKATIAEVVNTAVEQLASALEIAIVKNGNARVTDQLDGRDIIAEVSRKPGQAIAFFDTEVVPVVVGVFKEAGSGGGIGAPIPGGIPDVVIAVDPRILWALGQANSSRKDSR